MIRHTRPNGTTHLVSQEEAAGIIAALSGADVTEDLADPLVSFVVGRHLFEHEREARLISYGPLQAPAFEVVGSFVVDTEEPDVDPELRALLDEEEAIERSWTDYRDEVLYPAWTEADPETGEPPASWDRYHERQASPD